MASREALLTFAPVAVLFPSAVVLVETDSDETEFEAMHQADLPFDGVVRGLR